MKTPQFLLRILQFTRTLGKGPGPLRTVLARFPGTRLKQAASALRVRCGFPALAGLQGPLAGCVHEAGLVSAGRAGSPVVGEVAGGYRLAGDLQPPPFPLAGGLGRLVRRQEVVPAERAPRVLPGEQAQGVLV